MGTEGLNRVFYTVVETRDNAGPGPIVDLKIDDLLGTAATVAPGEVFLARSSYRVTGVTRALPLRLAGQGESSGKQQTITSGEGRFEVTAEIHSVVAGQERILDLFIKDDDTGQYLALVRLRLVSVITVQREGDRFWIEGVPDIKMPGVMDLHGMEILLRHRGEQVSYDDLLVYSGEAFHLCHGTLWETRTGLCMPFNPYASLAEAYGYDCRWTEPDWFFAVNALGQEGAWRKSEAFLEQLWSEVDAGHPVLMGGAFGQCAAWRAVVGYDRQQKRICYVGGEMPYQWSELVDEKVRQFGFWDMQVRGPINAANFGYGGWLANAAFFLGDRKSDRTETERAVAAMKQALRIFHTEEFQTQWYGGVTYSFGEQAYLAAASDLAALDYPSDLKKEGPKPTDAYDMVSLDGQVNTIVTGRTAAAMFAARAATLFPNAAPHLNAAAMHYHEEVRVAQESLTPFLSKMSDAQREAWLSNQSNCQAGATAFRQMLEHERAAVAEIEQALAVIEVKATAVVIQRDGGKVWIEGVPHGGPGNSYARGLEVLLKHAGTPVEYDIIMGETGQAFILQAEADGPMIDGAVDVGWWPLASWGVTMRLNFLGQTVGRGFHLVNCDVESYRKDPAAHYRERYESEVKASIAAGKPLLAEQNTCFVVTGYDDGNPPLLGDCAVRDTNMMRRIDESPWGLIVMEDQQERMDRRVADRAALQYAVALGRDTVPVTGRFTGRKSFALWAAALRDTEHLGQARWHANMVLHLGINRRSAVSYLCAMSTRQPAAASAHLNAAAGFYRQELAELERADTSEPAMQSKTGRETLARLVESLSALEAGAIAEIEEAMAYSPDQEFKPTMGLPFSEAT